MAASDITVVAVERPSDPRVVKRPKSRRPGRRRRRRRPGRTGTGSVSTTPWSPVVVVRCQFAVGADPDAARNLVLAVGADETALVDPVVGDPAEHLVGVVGPGLVVGHVEEPERRVLGGAHLAEVAGHESCAGVVGFLAHDVVVLAARPAEREREQRAVAVAGHEPLPVERQVPGRGRLR
jgi:hypothetical protein